MYWCLLNSLCPSLPDELASEFVFKNVEVINEEVLAEINEYEEKYKQDNPDYKILDVAPQETQKGISKVKKYKNLPNIKEKIADPNDNSRIWEKMCSLMDRQWREWIRLST